MPPVLVHLVRQRLVGVGGLQQIPNQARRVNARKLVRQRLVGVARRARSTQPKRRRDGRLETNLVGNRLALGRIGGRRCVECGEIGRLIAHCRHFARRVVVVATAAAPTAAPTAAAAASIAAALATLPLQRRCDRCFEAPLIGG